MPRFSANISMMFTEHPFAERFAEARKAGFRAVEFLFPYDHDPGLLGAEVEQNDLEISVFNLFPGDWSAGARGFAAVPGSRAELTASVARALPYARAIKARQLHVMAGLADPDAESEARYVDAIRHAADLLGAHGITALIEPINPQSMPGYFLSQLDQALDLLERIDHPNAALQFDVFHREMTGGDVIANLAKAFAHLRHVQIAGVPERHEPWTGRLDYAPVFKALDGLGYTGWVGCEYNPRGTTLDGLAWFAPYRDQQA